MGEWGAVEGKDLTGKIIQWLLTDTKKEYTFEQYSKLWWSSSSAKGDDWSIKKWATALRKIAAILLGMDEEFLYTDEFKQMVLPECWNYQFYNHSDDVLRPGFKIGWISKPMTGRDFLQKLGTDAVRNGLHENAWVNALMSEYKQNYDNTKGIYPEYYPNWIITDTRFPNELTAVKEKGGITIRVNRPIHALSQQNNAGLLHTSETALDSAEFDHVIDNNGTIEELTEKIKFILQKEKLLNDS